MKKMYYRVKNAIVVCIYCYKNPHAINIDILKLSTELFEIIMKVATEKRPYMSKIGNVYMGECEEFVTIWAGSGVGASPTKRISELLAENAELKRQLSEHILIKQNQK
jgi:hypothetical protein